MAEKKDSEKEAKDKARQAADTLGGMSGKAAEKLGGRQKQIEDALKDAGAKNTKGQSKTMLAQGGKNGKAQNNRKA
jgi:hypothetical protein